MHTPDDDCGSVTNQQHRHGGTRAFFMIKKSVGDIFTGDPRVRDISADMVPEKSVDPMASAKISPTKSTDI